MMEIDSNKENLVGANNEHKSSMSHLKQELELLTEHINKAPQHPTPWLNLLYFHEAHTPQFEVIIGLSDKARAAISHEYYSHDDLAILYLKIVELLMYVARNISTHHNSYIILRQCVQQ